MSMSIETNENKNNLSLITLIDNGNIFLINGQYESAVSSYSKAIEKFAAISPNSRLDYEEDIGKRGLVLGFRAFSHRAEAFLNLQKVSSARQDCLASVSILDRVGNRDRLFLDDEVDACFRRLKKSEEMAQLGFINKDAEVMVSTHDKNSSRCINKNSLRPKSNSSDMEPEHPCPVTISESTGVKKKSLPACPKYQYYESDTFMTISILEPNVRPHNLNVNFSKKKICVILEKCGIPFTIVSGTLYGEVDASKCKIKYCDEKVLVKLRKTEKHEWNELLEDKKIDGPKDQVSSVSTGCNDDTSKETIHSGTKSSKSKTKQTRPYSSHRDWDAIERDLKNQEENEKPEGDEAINKLFRSIYKDANEDTKRAMIKSFQTSGGTCLSTNWGEVSKTDYKEKRMAPKGVEWKNWEGEVLSQKKNKQ